MKLGGELVGFSITRNGKETTKWLDKPICNTVTKHCLNNLLMYNGDNTLGDSNSLASLFVYCGSGTRTGVFNYCAYGSGTDATKTSDKTLKQAIVSPMSTKKQGGVPYNCNYLDNTNKVFKFRISHQFPASEKDVTINEIGWFHKIEPDGEFSLSSRVKLDFGIELKEGDVFSCTYQFTVTFDYVPTIIKDFFDGFDVKKQANLSGTSTYNSWNADNLFPMPYIRANGVARTYFQDSVSGIAGSERNETGKGAVYGLQNEVRGYYRYAYSFGRDLVALKSNFNLPTNFSNPNATSGNTVNQSIRILDYEVDSFYRDYEITCNDIWCDNEDIYGLIYNGEIYQFGHNVDGVFTPAPIHKESAKIWTFMFRQSWSTDILSPKN